MVKFYLIDLKNVKIINDNIIFSEENIWTKDLRENILFVGSNDMCEIYNYVNTYKNGIFIEASTDAYNRLKQNLLNTIIYNTNYIPVNSLVSSEQNKEYKFHIFNNNELSSSIYEPNVDKWAWPEVNVKETITLTSTTVSDILEKYNWSDCTYDVILDVQGAELEVLKGFGNLQNIKTLTVEVSTKEFYNGGVLFEKLNIFLINNNFILKHTIVCDHFDAIYINKKYS